MSSTDGRSGSSTNSWGESSTDSLGGSACRVREPLKGISKSFYYSGYVLLRQVVCGEGVWVKENLHSIKGHHSVKYYRSAKSLTGYRPGIELKWCSCSSLVSHVA